MTPLNFEHFRSDWPQLTELGGMVEQYMRSDASSAVTKMRIFTEQMLITLYRQLGFRVTPKPKLIALFEGDKFTLDRGLPPALSETQAKAIALDIGTRGGKAEMKVRHALLCNALKRLGPENDARARTWEGSQIILGSSDEVYVVFGRRSP